MTDLALAPIPTTVDLVVSADRAVQMTRQLDSIVKKALRDGVDYGTIPRTDGKKVLLKSGAEKLMRFYGLTARCPDERMVIVDEATRFTARVVCQIIHARTDYVVAEGLGYCSSQEGKYQSRSAATIANTVLKMAKKRALLDGVLNATCASGLFTQDLVEDEGELEDESPPDVRPPSTRPRQAAPPNGENVDSPPTGETPEHNKSDAQSPALQKRYHERVDAAAALGLPTEPLDLGWSNAELLTRLNALNARVQEAKRAHQ